MLNVQRLRVLREVLAQGSFSEAANALNYTQSAVSQAIATLEAEAGVTADRARPRAGSGRPPRGSARRARRAGSSLSSTRPRRSSPRSPAVRGGRLRMASFPTAGATLMPLAIAAFRVALIPRSTLSLAEGEPEEIVPRLRAGEFDLGLIFEFEGAGEGSGRACGARPSSRTR